MADSEWRRRTNDLIAKMKANPELVEFLVGMAQDGDQADEEPKARQATKAESEQITKWRSL